MTRIKAASLASQMETDALTYISVGQPDRTNVYSSASCHILSTFASALGFSC